MNGTLTIDLTHVENERVSVFGEDTSSQWSPHSEYNMVFLRAQEYYFNDKLQAIGHVFLNEVRDSLSLPRTPLGQLVGWFRDETISFGINEDEPGIFQLTFNFGGVIYDAI